jgi:hypothetical protein
MTKYMRTLVHACAAAGMLVVLGACNEHLTVENPTVVDATTVDPVADASTFSRSAQQDFAEAFGWYTMYAGWFAGEALVSETFPTRNDFGRRDIPVTNASLNTDVWSPLSVARAAADRAVEFLKGTPGEDKSLDVARSAMVSGFTIQLMAEGFCQGALNSGPALTPAMMLDTAIARFNRAITVGQAAAANTLLPAADRTEATSVVNASLVGKARAELQKGDKTNAALDADKVAAGFTFNLNYLDDPANRTHLSNRIWQYTFTRGSVAVAPAYRTLNDPRVVALAPKSGLTAQDGLTPFWTVGKYPAFTTPMRVASKIEADYIAAEARGTAAMLALSQARRAANTLPAYTGPTDDASVAVEFFDQRAREFYLEGKMLGDFRRNPSAVKNVPQPGATYYKSGYSPIGNQTCFPLPQVETSNNPNFPKA